jgi:hypothetical protein
VPSIEEVMAWSLSEIKDGIRLLLPKDWRFDHTLRDDMWHEVRILEPVSGGPDDNSLREDRVVWSDTSPDEKLVLYGAYGFLLARRHRPRPDSPWVRRPNAVRDAFRRKALQRFGAKFGTVPDPEDLDPEWIRSVYGSRLNRKP